MTLQSKIVEIEEARKVVGEFRSVVEDFEARGLTIEV